MMLAMVVVVNVMLTVASAETMMLTEPVVATMEVTLGMMLTLSLPSL